MHRLQPWLIIALGGIAGLAGMFAVASLAHLGYTLFPGAWGWVGTFHVLGTGAAWFLISKPFIEAHMLREFLENINGR
jgi:hypothetical protein